MPEFETFQFGNVTFPLEPQAGGTSLLSVCDPALAKLIDFLAFEIDRKLATALTDAVALGTPPIGLNIAKRLSVEPVADRIKADQLRFPLFAMWRDESRMTDRTFNWRQDAHRVGWCYVLPPMTLEWADKFAHVLHAVVDIVNYSLHQGFDPAYNAGERIIADNNITSAKCTMARYGLYKLGDLTDTLFHSVFGELEVVEQSRPSAAGLTPYTGADAVITDESVQENNPIEVVPVRFDP